MFGRLLALCLCSVLFAGGAAAASSGAQAPPSPAPADTTAPAEAVQAAPAAPDTSMPKPTPVRAADSGRATVIYGTATLENGYPLPELTAILFVGGLEEASATTDTSGVYSIRHPIDMSSDETVVLWFTPPRGMGFMRDIVVLRESRAARETRQFGPCMPHVPLSDSTLVDVVVLDQQAYAAKLQESGCMDLVEEPAGEYELKYDLSAGDSFVLRTSSSNKRSQTLAGEEMAVTTGYTSTYDVVVDSVGPNGMALAIEYQNRTYTTGSSQARGSVNFAPLIGQKAFATLSSQGEFSRPIGFDALPEIEIGPNQTLDKDAYVKELKHLFPTLSAGPVEEGGTWQHDYTVNETGAEGGLTAIKVDVTYTLVGETTFQGVPCFEIDAESVITVKGQGSRGGTPFTLNMSGTGSAKIYFDSERGMVLEKRGTSKVEGAIESSGMSIPLVNEGESSLEVDFQ